MLLLAACESTDLYTVDTTPDATVSASDSGIDLCANHEPSICYGSNPETAIHPPCRVGLTTCRNGVIWCWGEVGPEADDTCGDGIDNDCDGVIDNGTIQVKPLDVVIIVDRSVSMSGFLPAIRQHLETLVLTVPANYFLIDVPGVISYLPRPNAVCYPDFLEWPIDKCPNPTEAIHRLSTHQGGLELTYDALWGVTREGWIRWTPGASRAIVLLTDESGQSLNYIHSESDLGWIPDLQSYVVEVADFDDIGSVFPLDYPIQVSAKCE